MTMENYYPAHRDPAIGRNINPEWWPKRRRVIVQLLDNARPGFPMYYVRMLAGQLAEQCKANYHPKCARIIEAKLNGWNLSMEDLLDGKYR
jgi:hypothetical protein